MLVCRVSKPPAVKRRPGARRGYFLERAAQAAFSEYCGFENLIPKLASATHEMG